MQNIQQANAAGHRAPINDEASSSARTEGLKDYIKQQSDSSDTLSLAQHPLVMTMTSKEMADLTEKRHDNVKRTIETLANQGVIAQPQIEDGEKAANGVVEKLYRIGKRDSYIIVAQLSPEFTARLVDRWQQLEEQARNPIAALSRVDLLKLALDSEEQRLVLETKVNAQSAVLALQAPKVAALDVLTTRTDGALCITNSAKDLQVQPKRLFSWLQEHDWIYRRAGGSGYVAHQARIKSGLLEHKITTVERSDGSAKMVEQVLVTAKGLAKLAAELGTEGVQ